MSISIKTTNRKHLAFSEDQESKWNGPFCFIQAADTQFGLIDAYLKKLLKIDEAYVTWTEDIRLTKLAIAAANRMEPRPRFFVVCGDLVHAMPGTRHQKAQRKDWNKAFEDLDNEIPLVCVCGNHDLGETPTVETVKDYVKSFGTEDYFSFWCGGVYNIVLNSQFFEDPSKVMELSEEQMDWIDVQLDFACKKKATHIFIFQHIPYFIHDVDEAKQYFNLDNPVRSMMLNKFLDAGVTAIFCGHYHRNGGAWIGDMEHIITTAVGGVLGDEPSGVRVVNVYENRIEHKYYPLSELPAHSGLLKE